MKNYRKHIDDFFREKLGKYRETPPADVWDDLSVRLDTLKPFVPGSPYRWLWHVGMASVVAVFSVSLVKKLNKPATEAQHTVVAEKAVTAPAATTPPVNEPAVAQNTLADNAVAQNTLSAVTHEPVQQEAIAKHDRTSIAYEKYTPSGRGYKAGSKHAARSTAFGEPQMATHNGPVTSAARNAEMSSPAENVFHGAVKAERQNDAVNVKATTQDAITNVITPIKKVEKPAKIEEPKVAQRAQEDKKNKLHNNISLGYGVKAGYERGFNDGAANKYVISPYLQVKLSSKLAVLVQPSVKYAQLNNRTLNTQSYYKVTSEETKAGTYYTTNGPSDVTYYTPYTYTARYDSIVKVRSFGGSYAEFELPLMLQYSVSPKLSVYGGVNVALTRMSGVQEQTYTTHKMHTADTIVDNPVAPYPGPAPDLSYKVHYTVAPYSDYTTPAYVNTQETRLRLGYTLGFSYEYSQKWLFDALMVQSPLKPDLKEGYNVNVPLSTAYFRLSVGYKLK